MNWLRRWWSWRRHCVRYEFSQAGYAYRVARLRAYYDTHDTITGKALD